jgi:hypothetical protein
MKVYRFGNEPCVCYQIIIEEDNGEIRTATVGLKTITEYIAEPITFKSGITRLNYGSGSSMPYKNADGTLCEKYIEI